MKMQKVRPHLLLIDNDIPLQKERRDFLKYRGYRVTLAMNAAQAYAYLMSPWLPHGWYDLVLMNIDLPDKDGITLCRELRKVYTAEELPIIGLTAEGVARRVECVQAGMQGFLTTPLTALAWIYIFNLI